MTIGDIVKENPDDIRAALFDYGIDIFCNAKNEGKALRKANEVVRNVYLAQILCDEINNGGFIQYFFNQDSAHFELIEGALSAIGMTALSGIYKDAFAALQAAAARQTFNISASNCRDLEKFSGLYDDNEEFDAFDDRFYELDKDETNTYGLIEAYVKAHLNDKI
ncbi:MAG: DMP19 family protein [Clostridiales bacterium]|nr:DMP19 family protein [Clostridiales bacterium]